MPLLPQRFDRRHPSAALVVPVIVLLLVLAGLDAMGLAIGYVLRRRAAVTEIATL
jgi:hypothetical protein